MLWATTRFAGLRAQSWVEVELIGNQLSYLKSHWVRRRITQVMCGWLRGWPLTSGSRGILFSPGNGIANEMSTIRAARDCFGRCSDIAEPLMRNHSIVPAAKRWCCYCKEEEKKAYPALFSGVWSQPGSRGRAKDCLCFFQVTRCLGAVLMYRTPCAGEQSPGKQ